MWFPYTLISKQRLISLEMAKSFGEGWARGSQEPLLRITSQDSLLDQSSLSRQLRNETLSIGKLMRSVSESDVHRTQRYTALLPSTAGTTSRNTRRSRMRSSSLTNRGSWGRGPGRKRLSKSQSRTRGYSLAQLQVIRGLITSQYSLPMASTETEPSSSKNTSSSIDSASFPKLIDSFKSEDSYDTGTTSSSRCRTCGTQYGKPHK